MAEPDVDPCHCPHLALGLKVLEQRNWNPDCPVHGTDSEWWNSEDQQTRRAVRRHDLIAKQALARRLRQAAQAEREAREAAPDA